MELTYRVLKEGTTFIRIGEIYKQPFFILHKFGKAKVKKWYYPIMKKGEKYDLIIPDRVHNEIKHKSKHIINPVGIVIEVKGKKHGRRYFVEIV